jgi:hypothetical protein
MTSEAILHFVKDHVAIFFARIMGLVMQIDKVTIKLTANI